MTFDHTQQKMLLKWLKQQVRVDSQGVRFSILLGLVNGVLIVLQAWLLATLLHSLIIDKAEFRSLLPYFCALIIIILLKATANYFREQINFAIGIHIKHAIRKQVFDHLEHLGPAFIKEKSTGAWSTLLIEQIEDLQDFYSRYLPQIKLAVMVPLLIIFAVLCLNWAAALILLITAPLIPLFMTLVGMGAADINRRNFLALHRLSGHFLDRVKSIETIRIFNQGKRQAAEIKLASDNFRKKTMEVLRMAFLSSGVLEFFSSISIAIVAVYFGFSYLGRLNFGAYATTVSLFAGFFTLLLAPEFFQPLRDLGTFYHAKAQAVAAANAIHSFLSIQPYQSTHPNMVKSRFTSPLDRIVATDLTILTHSGKPLLGPLSFTLRAGEHIALVGKSGEGKTSLVNALLGFLPYQGSLTVNGIELNTIDMTSWRSQLSWVGQNPYFPAHTVRDNILLADPSCNESQLTTVLKKSFLTDFILSLPDGVDTNIGEEATRLSVGQAQRVAIARSLIKSSQLLILDEPTASLDKGSRSIVNEALNTATSGRTVITITHHQDTLDSVDAIWQLHEQKLVVKKVHS